MQLSLFEPTIVSSRWVASLLAHLSRLDWLLVIYSPANKWACENVEAAIADHWTTAGMAQSAVRGLRLLTVLNKPNSAVRLVKGR